MKIVSVRQSLETCTESGWDAVDMLLDEPIEDSFIDRLRLLEGSFIYMKALKKPFFKLEYHDYMIKGIKGNDHFRMAYHKDSVEKVDRVITVLNGTENQQPCRETRKI